jgi:hypothetical protein
VWGGQVVETKIYFRFRHSTRHVVVKSVPRTFQQTSRVWPKKCLEHWTNEKVGYILSQLEYIKWNFIG